MTFDTDLTDFNPGQFKTLMKEMAPQVDVSLSLNAFLARVQYDARKLIKILIMIYNGKKCATTGLKIPKI